MYSIFLRFPFSCVYKSVDCEQNGIHCPHLHNIISTTTGFSDFSLYCNGKKIPAGGYVLPNSTVHVSFSLPGGKGGFGSMLRAIGAQIEKTTNREACRDLSGRRLRDINEEQRLKNWISKKSEREAEKMRRRKERLERLKSRPKHNFVDFEYEKEISELPERIDDALSAGMEKVKKRPSDIGEPSTSGNSKKKRLWLGEDISESSDSDSDLSSLKSYEERGEPLTRSDADNLLRSMNALGSSGDSLNAGSEHNGGGVPESSATSCYEVTGSEAEDNPETTTAFNLESVVDSALSSDDCLKDKNNVQNDVSMPDIDDDTPIHLNDYQDVKELKSLGLGRLKKALMLRGLKCGGNIDDRAARLWAIRSLSPHQYPKNLLAKTPKK